MVIEGTSISMIRGDSEIINVKIAGRGIQNGDTIEFTVRKTAEDPKKWINQAITYDGDTSDNPDFKTYPTPAGELVMAVIRINPDMFYSEEGDMPFGDYVYDVRLRESDGTVTTLVACSKFSVKEEVSYGSN